MNIAELKRRSEALTAETVDALRNKPVESTMYDRMCASAEASRPYRNLPRPLYTGNGMFHIAKIVATPVSPDDILVGRVPEKLLNEEEERHFAELCRENEREGFFMCDWGHTPFEWEEIMRVGISGYVEKSETELRRRREAHDDEKRINALECMNLVHRAYRLYIERYAEAAEDAGLSEIAEVCRNISKRPPQSFIEAIQLVLLMGIMFSAYSCVTNATMCLGRMDDYLLRFYKHDIDAGVITEEAAGYIIDDFYCKWSLPIGRGEHQMSWRDGNETGWDRNPMYDSPTYVMLGGYSHHGEPSENPLTRLFLERINPRFENPVFVFRRTDGVTNDMWTLVCDKLRENSSLLVYNDETMIPALEFAGVEHDDAVNYTIHGCNWPDVQGLNTYCTVGGPLASFIMKSIFGEDGRPTADFKSIDDIYKKIADDYRAYAKVEHETWRRPNEGTNTSEDIKCADAFKAGCIENATSGVCGTKYHFILHKIRHIGSGADVMAALDDVLFGADPVPIDTLADALAADFEGYPEVLIRCQNAPKYGHDDERADAHATRLVNMLCDIVREESIDRETGKFFVNAPCVAITDMFYVEEGSELGATPDGRRAHAPFSENLSPSRGQYRSVTAMMNSVTKLPFDKICSGALNIRLPRSLVEADEGLERLCTLLSVYFKKGGMQAQLSVTDVNELLAAQEKPEDYKDLMVRITGYSAVFIDMSRSAQDEVIARER